MKEFIRRLLTTKKVACPRCLGKGNVEMEDIIRLGKELYWRPGKCAYCVGRGKVPARIASTIPADITYLTTDVSKAERNRLLERDENALYRARMFEAGFNEVIREIEHLYFIENFEPARIADFLLEKYQDPRTSPEEKQEFVDYIEKVIKSKTGN